MHPGEENLIPMNKRPEEEQRALRLAAGKASGAARRRKKSMQQAAKLMLDLQLTEGQAREQIRALGVADEDLTNQMAIIASMMMKAISGDVHAAQWIRDTAGESPQYKLQQAELKRRKEEMKMRQEAGCLDTPTINIVMPGGGSSDAEEDAGTDTD